MESKIQIDVNASSREARIFIKHVPSEDLRDSVLGYLIHDACPDVYDSTGSIVPTERPLDGYCRLSILGNAGSYTAVEIVPIHPMKMPKHIKTIEENAGKYPKEGMLPGYENHVAKVSPWKQILHTVDMPLGKDLVARSSCGDGTYIYIYDTIIRTSQRTVRFKDQETDSPISNSIWNEWEWLDESSF